MTELWVWAEDRTHQYFCATIYEALVKAAEALKQGKPVKLIPHGDTQEM